jgi:hypothetical protein
LFSFSFSHFPIPIKGLFPKEAFVFVPYASPDKLVDAIQNFEIHVALPINGAVDALRSSKGIAFIKVLVAWFF